MTKDTPSPHGSMEISQLACQCLDRRRKKRPRMTEVGESIQMLVCLFYYDFSSVSVKLIVMTNKIKKSLILYSKNLISSKCTTVKNFGVCN